MGVETADFSGWATKANLKCSDGRTIMPDAFKHQDQVTVPLVWAHTHNDPENVLGHALLENRPEGVYCYAWFNDTERGKSSKLLVQHGDVNSLSIFANKLVEKSKMVIHGMIREVSLVLAGANDGAKIDFVRLQHSDDPNDYDVLEDEAVIHTGLALEHSSVETEEGEDSMEHAENSDETVGDVFNSLSDKQKDVVYYLIGQAAGAGKGSDSAAQSDSEDGLSHEDIQEVFASFDEKQELVVRHMLNEALQHSVEDNGEANADAAENDNSAAHADDAQEGNDMTIKHNVFENGAAGNSATGTTLSHDDVKAIFELADEKGSLAKAAKQYATGVLKHGIDAIDTLFPDAKSISSTPDFVKRRTEWVSRVLTGTRHVPWSRIKSLTADLTPDEARAKGYIKGNLKKEEFFAVAKRETVPQTIYKKQALDRDDILDITDFDVVVWIKAEMRLMLDEEIARAVLIGDGRSNADEDKIKEDHVRPIATDDDLYVTRLYVNIDDSLPTGGNGPQEVIDAITLQRRHYRGSGTPTFFTSETFLAQMLLVKDGMGRRVYNTTADIAAALRVSDVVTCEVLDEPSNNVLGIMVNLQDYTIGADKGGDVTLFEDFDIDYNKEKYLLETRISGALVRPKAALVVLKTASNAVEVAAVAPSWNGATHTVTVATTAGVTYKNAETGATLTTASPVTLSEGETLSVIATPNSGYFFTTDSADEFDFSYDNGPVGQAH